MLTAMTDGSEKPQQGNLEFRRGNQIPVAPIEASNIKRARNDRELSGEKSKKAVPLTRRKPTIAHVPKFARALEKSGAKVAKRRR